MNRDIASNLLVVKAFDSNFTIEETKVGAGIDTSHYDGGVMFACAAYSYSTGTFAIKLQESPDNSVWSDVPATKLILPDGSLPTFTAETVALNLTPRFGAFSTDQWLRLSVTSTGTVDGSIKVYAIKKSEIRPVE